VGADIAGQEQLRAPHEMDQRFLGGRCTIHSISSYSPQPTRPVLIDRFVKQVLAGRLSAGISACVTVDEDET
jgi:hypothetical protein